MSGAAVEAGARAWFDRIQSQRMDTGSRRPDGQRWQWEDLTESDRVAYRALARPIVDAAQGASHAGEHVCCDGIRRGGSQSDSPF